MNTLLFKLLLFGIVLNFTNAFSQNSTKQAKDYFAKFKSQQEVINLCLSSLPTLEDCKLIFNESDASSFLSYIENVKSKMNASKNDTIQYHGLQVESFTTSDIIEGKGNYVEGMKNLVDKLQPNITFYKIEFLKEKDAENGVSYKYWVNLNNRWIFLPKPYNAFKDK